MSARPSPRLAATMAGPQLQLKNETELLDNLVIALTSVPAGAPLTAVCRAGQLVKVDASPVWVLSPLLRRAGEAGQGAGQGAGQDLILPDFSNNTVQQLLRLVSLDWNNEDQIIVDNEVRDLMEALGMDTSRLVSVKIEEIEEDDNPDSNTVAPVATLETDKSSLAPTSPSALAPTETECDPLAEQAAAPEKKEIEEEKQMSSALTAVNAASVVDVAIKAALVFSEPKPVVIRKEFDRLAMASAEMTGEKGKAECPQCNKLFSNKHNLKFHIKTVHGSRKQFSCEKCSYQSSQKICLIRHIDALHNKTKLNCKICLKSYKWDADLRRHIESNHFKNPQANICVCGKIYKTRRSLNLHKKTSHGTTEMIDCTKCPGEFKTASSFKLHVKLKHTDDRKIHYCNVCKYQSKLRSDVRRHIKQVHEGKKRKSKKQKNFEKRPIIKCN